MGTNELELSRDEQTSDGSAHTQKRTAKSGRQRTAEWRARVEERFDRVKRIADKAEIVNQLLLSFSDDEITLPKSLVCADVEHTLDNITEHLREDAQNKRIGASRRSKRKQLPK